MSSSSIFNINVFTPKAGQGDAFARAQLVGLPRLGAFTGWRGGRLFQTTDGERLVLVSEFDTLDAQQGFAASEPFRRHRDSLVPLVARSEAGLYRLIYERP